MKISCLIVDDEPLAIKVLENYVGRIDALELSGTCRNATDAYNLIKEKTPDLIFLDIQMPKLSGIELAKVLGKGPQIIFTTAFRDFAVESYEINALDYLVKPISFERFLKAVEKLEIFQEKTASDNIQVENTTESCIYLKAESKVFKILLKDLIFIESFKDYIVVHSKHESITCYQNISQLEQMLPTNQFMRIHRSFIISLDKISSFNSNAVFIKDKEFPIGRTYKENTNLYFNSLTK